MSRYDSWKLDTPPRYEDHPAGDPEQADDSDEDGDTVPEATPVLGEDGDPGEHLEPHKPDLGGSD